MMLGIKHCHSGQKESTSKLEDKKLLNIHIQNTTNPCVRETNGNMYYNDAPGGIRYGILLRSWRVHKQ